jgi:biotin transport system substrate-specific component
MNLQTQLEHSPTAFPSVGTGLRNLSIVLAGSAFVAVSAHISLPLGFTPVPLTLQPFAVLLLGLVLAPRLAAATLAAYLLEGVAGLPVFTPTYAAMSGLAHMFGPTGGYLLSYPFAVYAIARIWRSSSRGPRSRSLGAALFSAAVGNLIILAVGASWLSVLTHASLGTVLSQAVIPFLPGDALKVAVAAALGFEWARIRQARFNS